MLRSQQSILSSAGRGEGDGRWGVESTSNRLDAANRAHGEPDCWTSDPGPWEGVKVLGFTIGYYRRREAPGCEGKVEMRTPKAMRCRPPMPVWTKPLRC